ncbi:MAG: aldehyde dehydrogenase family protein [Deltaproteobacteria bacterium]|nr:aldehyde dehydrogenase family protein [Deltaproteobacteria bacterium]
MEAALSAPAATGQRSLDEAVERLAEGAPSWAAAPLGARIALLRSIQSGLWRAAPRMAEAACRAKGLDPAGPAAAEEWLGGPYTCLRFVRQLLESLAAIARSGTTPVGRLSRSRDGRLVEEVFPAGGLDRLVYMGIRGEIRYPEGVDEPGMREARARFHRTPDHRGRICLVLGAGNVNSIPVADALAKLFNEGKVCVLKVNPVNAYVGPFLEEAFREAIDRKWLQVVYGGAAEGAYLAQHPSVDEVHITGSDRTHDAIVWGPPGPDRASRMARGEPLLRKEITSELGSVTPVLVMPGPWSPRQLALQAEGIAGAVVNNGSFNCIAAKMLVLPRGWKQRQAFLDLLWEKLSLAPPRHAWYPGAHDRYRALTGGREGLRTGATAEGAIPWTLLPGLDSSSEAEPAFHTEPFCALLSETAVGSEDPLEYLAAAVEFANRRLWGTLSAMLLAPPAYLADPVVGEAVDGAVAALRYGSVCVNVWSAFAYLAGTLPWGAHPGSTLRDIQSGRGFVHDTRMVGPIEKAVVWAPAAPLAKLPHFPSHRNALPLARRLTSLEATGSWLELPGVLGAGLRG